MSVLAGLLAVFDAAAISAPGNPFEVIAVRNVFRLVAPERMERIEKPLPPRRILPKVVVTGLTDVCGRDQALMEMTEPGRPTSRIVLGEGERFGGLEVLSIDVPRDIIRIRLYEEEIQLSLSDSSGLTSTGKRRIGR